MAVSAAIRGERPAWLNARTAFGLALFLVSVASGWLLLGPAERGIGLWAAARDLPAGVPLNAEDLVMVTTDLPSDQLAVYLGGSADLDGATLTRPMREGELLAADFVAPEGSPAHGREMTVPITAEHAVGGRLVPGDRVDVFATTTSGAGEPRTTLVVSSAQILDLVTASGFTADESSLVGLTLEIDHEDAADLAVAIRSADIDIARVRGDASSPPSSAEAGGS